MVKKLGSVILDFLQVVVFAVSIFLFVYLLILQPHKIKGRSMEPNFLNGEFLLTDKISYRFNEPKRGDVIVFRAPPDYKDEFIKRIIGLPGETVIVKNGHVYINNTKLSEPYLPENTYTPAGTYATEDNPVIVEEGKYFVMGDNRKHSLDSRSFGPIRKEKITGKAWFVYWPPSKVGTVENVIYNEGL